MGYIDLDSEIKALKKEFEDKIGFLEGRIKYLEELIGEVAQKKEG